jgi:hypothetical protein
MGCQKRPSDLVQLLPFSSTTANTDLSISVGVVENLVRAQHKCRAPWNLLSVG